MCDWITRIVKENTSIFIINDLSIELKNKIRDNLVSICYGKQAPTKNPKSYSYKKTLAEFLKRYETKELKLKKGMIGELLTHIIFIEYITGYEPISLYFNLEERHIKKGFDVLYVDEEELLWITEVKSGELGSAKNSHAKNLSLINIAKNDLVKRLADDDLYIWQNAIHGAYVAMKESKVKDSVITILEEDKSLELHSGKEHNVILSSVLFNDINDPITLKGIRESRERIIESDSFRNVIVLSIQKNTFTAVEEFLKGELSNG
ncbi:DUF1837 domain-containing protein [Vallitalea guaymasensis]|uniref:DUF1837 domain-containing protein n=1 Tax=Vallitalea guaymasensis TaxID=1185412 RepID=UPI000DE32E59|nr:DUF1837 domain-containing protein [Vallitalea guaymasensis]